MNSTGLAWSGSVPERWAVCPLGYRYEVQLGKMLNPEATDGTNPAPYLRNTDVQWGRVNTSDLPQMSFDARERAKFSLRRGDLLVCEGGDVGRSAIWRGELAVCFYQKAVHRVRPWRGADEPRFLYYVMRAASWRGAFQADGNKSTIAHLPAEKLRATRLPFPPDSEQRAIADFLDRKTAAIDALIQKKEQHVALLTEKRRATILTAVVTYSGRGATGEQTLPWAPGLVACRNWKIQRLGWNAHIGNGSTPARDDPRYWTESPGGFPWMNSTRINDGRITTADNWVTDIALRECHLPAVAPGSVLVAITGEGQTRGRAALLTIRATISQHLVYIAPNRSRLMSSFLWRQLEAMYGWMREESEGGGSTRAALTCEFIRKLPIVVPPLADQDAVVRQLEEQLGQLDGTLSALRSSIALLRDYRQALVTAAVTGQLDLFKEAA